MNEHSSRSHTIFKIVIESRERQAEEQEEDMFSEFSTRSKKKSKRGSNGSSRSSTEGGAVKVSSIHLVDLAGSERISQTGAEGLRLKEGGHINKSLLTLGTVIQKLSSSQGGHVPFRDSKLTRILQNALGGNSKTAIICTIAPALLNTEESLSTLQFATRAKTIKNKPEVNEVVDDKAMLKRLQKEVQELRSQLGKMKEDALHEEMKLLQSEKLKVEEDRSILELKLRSQEDKIQKYAQLIVVSSLSSNSSSTSKPEKVSYHFHFIEYLV